MMLWLFSFFFFFNDTATTEIYTLSLHDALPIFFGKGAGSRTNIPAPEACPHRPCVVRSEEHTSELQSRLHLVCRLLLEKKKKTKLNRATTLTQTSKSLPHPTTRHHTATHTSKTS